MPFTDPTSQDYTTAPNHPGHQHNNGEMPIPGSSALEMAHAFQPMNKFPALSVGPPMSSFSIPSVVHPAVFQSGPSIGHHPVQRPTVYYFGPSTLATAAGPSSFLANWTLFTDTNPLQMPTPSNSHLMSTVAMDMLSPDVQGYTGSVFQQSPLATASNQVPHFPQPPSRYATDNPMGRTYSMNTPVAPNRMQEPPLDSRHNRLSDPEVHQAYRGVRLQAVLKDPRNQQTTAPVKIRREKKVVIELVLHSDTGPFSRWGWEAIEIPQTSSVKPTLHTFSGKHLKLSTQVLGCSTGVPNVQPCSNCWERERQTIDPKLNLQPYMIKFRAESRIVALSRPLYGDDKCLKVEVTFYFTCFSKHHGGLYGLILKLHDEIGNLVAHCLLPYKFIVKANGNDNSNDTGGYEPRVHTESRQQNLWSGFPVPNPPSVPILECRTPELDTNIHPVPVDHHSHFNLNYPASVLHKLAPAEGPMSGGQTIFLSGTNFPQPSQQVVFARFGSVVVTTIWHNQHTLECKLPPSPIPGTVGITLSLYQKPGAPEFGQSHCWFEYTQKHDYFYSLLCAISGQEHTLAPETWDALVPHFLQNVSPVGRALLQQQLNAPPMNQSFSIGAGEMEGFIVQFLTSFANSPSWEKTISLVNEHRQTLAHLAVLFRYTTLLDKVAEWGINVDVQDMNGFTALHCAYLCGDLDSAGILKGYGADEDIRDNLGRRPADMYIPRMNDQGKGFPSSDRTSSSVQISGTGDEWEQVSVTSSQSGGVVDYNSASPPASRHQQPHTRQPTTSSRIMPAPISMPSAMSYAQGDERWIDVVSGLDLSDSPISEACLPISVLQSTPTDPPECRHSYPVTRSSNPTPQLSVCEARTLPSRGSGATSSQEGVHSVARSLISPPPLIQMPLPSPSLPDIPAYGHSSVLPQTAHSSASTSCHHTNPCTKAGLDGRPVTLPTSAGPHITRRFDPPPHPPPARSGSNTTSAKSPIFSAVNVPTYEEGPQTFSRDKKWPLSDEINDPEESKGDTVRSGEEKGKQPFHVPIEWETLAEELPADVKKRLLELAVQEVARLHLRPGNA